MSGCGILTNGKGTRREYCEFSLDELQVCCLTCSHTHASRGPAVVNTRCSLWSSLMLPCWLAGGRSHRLDAQSQRSASFLHQWHRPRWDPSRGDGRPGLRSGGGQETESGCINQHRPYWLSQGKASHDALKVAAVKADDWLVIDYILTTNITGSNRTSASRLGLSPQALQRRRPPPWSTAWSTSMAWPSRSPSCTTTTTATASDATTPSWELCRQTWDDRDRRCHSLRRATDPTGCSSTPTAGKRPPSSATAGRRCGHSERSRTKRSADWHTQRLVLGKNQTCLTPTSLLQRDWRLQPRRGAEQPATALQRGVPGPHRQDGGQVGGLYWNWRDDAQPCLPAAALNHDQPALWYLSCISAVSLFLFLMKQ